MSAWYPSCSLLFRTQRLTPAYTRVVRSEDLRRWTAARRAAEARERVEQRQAGPAPDSAIAAALALVALAGRLTGWPPAEDPVSQREDAEAYRQWARLRAALGRHGRTR